ncbi:cupin domain-containing protein [Streptomyces sp. E-08]|uniref:cupin domain-containing protein n=1 Tax=Streptomyces sp. E-08 TaxID=3404047 RepID=UPI003CF26BEE
MAGIVRKSFDAADETRPFEGDKGRLDLLIGDGGPVGRAVFEPGWRWSQHVKPIAGTDSCQASHVGYVISGRMKVVMDDGETVEFGEGDYMEVKPGHDAWVVGDEACVALDWTGFGNYALPPTS